MGEIADQIFDEVLDDELNGTVCPIHNIWYNKKYTYCWMCEEGLPSINESEIMDEKKMSQSKVSWWIGSNDSLGKYSKISKRKTCRKKILLV